MTQLDQQSAYLQIEDQLDAIGQKYRGLQIVRGAILWVVTFVLSSGAAGVAGHFAGERRGWAWVILICWASIVLLSTVFWLIRPILIRPAALAMARLLETRVEGLHNGLTNSVLLSQAEDLQDSPWLAPIFEEVCASITQRPIQDAVRWRDLRSMALRATIICIPLMIFAFFFSTALAQGWQQMFRPGVFVPTIGSLRIMSVLPGNVTLVAGQALEITVSAQGAGMPPAKLIFDDGTRSAVMTPTILNSSLRYTYRLEHLDHSLKYRVEVGSTQSGWFNATVVRQIKLVKLTARITPPAYTNKAATMIEVKSDQMETTPIIAPQGSLIELSARMDVSTNGAMMQVGETSPTPMTANIERAKFDGSLTLNEDTPVAFLLMDGAGQIVATVPEKQLVLPCLKDAAPVITMKWPREDSLAPTAAPVRVEAGIKDDYGIASARVLMASGTDEPLSTVSSITYPNQTVSADISSLLEIKQDVRKRGGVIRLQVEAIDNRDLPGLSGQTVSSPVFEIKFRDPEVVEKEQKNAVDQLRAVLLEILRKQEALHSMTVAVAGGKAASVKNICTGQTSMRAQMQTVADTFAFEPADKVIQKTLLVLALNPAKDAVDLSSALIKANGKDEQRKISERLQAPQRRIISTLQSLLAMLNASPEPTSQPTTREGGQLVSKPDEFKKLDEALRQYMKEQQRILDQTTGLAKKPVDNFDDKDRQLLKELSQQQDKLDAFMQGKIADFSKLAEQDMSNASLLKDLVAIYSEVTMAKDALNQQAVEIAVPAEENGLEGAKELETNIEKWLSDSPDRQKWTQEELPDKSDTPMAELPKELDDMVGELLEQQEDLFDQVEDMDANITDSIDKGVGWDAADGPIADMSAKGVTGNVLPNNNEMSGRSGEGRSGQSQGEFVGDNAIGKGGRNTPTRLDPTPFEKGQINDTSKDPVGGATGGGKMSGSGAAGLEGPVPPQMQLQMKRLAARQAEVRNTAERLNLQYQLNRYDNFKLLQSIALMRRVESDLNANRYQTALQRKDVLLDDMDTSHLLLSGRIHVEHDTTPTTSLKREQALNDAMKGEMPAAWEDALKEYYKKLAAE